MKFSFPGCRDADNFCYSDSSLHPQRSEASLAASTHSTFAWIFRSGPAAKISSRCAVAPVLSLLHRQDIQHHHSRIFHGKIWMRYHDR